MKFYCSSHEGARLEAIKAMTKYDTKSVSIGFNSLREKWYVEIEDFSIEEEETFWKWEDAQRLKVKSTKE